MNINPGIEVLFENKKFQYCKDPAGEKKFDTYVLKSESMELKFQKEGFEAVIITSKFPNGLYGFGYRGTALRNHQQCYCHGDISSKTFKSEFEAQCAAINYILKNEISTEWNRHFIRLQMLDFINPKTLF